MTNSVFQVEVFWVLMPSNIVLDADVPEVHAASLKMEAAWTSENLKSHNSVFHL
jgi:hypothetical protein